MTVGNDSGRNELDGEGDDSLFYKGKETLPYAPKGRGDRWVKGQVPCGVKGQSPLPSETSPLWGREGI